MTTKTVSRSALDRLGAMIEASRRDPSNTGPWQHYILGLAADAPELVADPVALRTTLALMGELGGKGSGWKSRAEIVEQTVRDARRSSPRAPADLVLDCDTDGRPRRTPSNAEKVLGSDPSWAGSFRLNLLTDRVEWDGAPLTDEAVTEIQIRLDRTVGLVLDEKAIGRVLRLVAKREAYHPVRDYLTRLRWDGVARLHHLLGTYMSCETPETPDRVPGDDGSPLLEAIGRRWMLSAVARAMQPGCKVDTVLILQGDRQGQRKSTAFEVLGGEWYRNTRLEIDSKDVYQQIAGCWIYEIQEIDGMLTRKHASDLKSFCSSRVDTYRRPYGENVVDQPRGLVFSGTTNREKILLDPTGSRRFWPVKIAAGSRVDVDRLTADRDQLWAEAMQLYRDGVQWYLTDEEDAALDGASDPFRAEDVWEEHFAQFLHVHPQAAIEGFTTVEVLAFMQIPADRQGDSTTERIQRVIRDAGFHAQRRRRDGTRQYLWTRSGR